MNKYRVFGIISIAVSFTFFVLMIGFVVCMEIEAIGLFCGMFGAFASAALWIVWGLLSDFFLSGGF